MSNGTVKWFNAQKGYGFIQAEGGGKDVFVHISAVERAGLRELREGQHVSFEIVVDRKTGKSAAENLKSAGVAGLGGSGLKEARLPSSLRWPGTGRSRRHGRVEISTDQVAPFFSVSMVRPATAQHQVGVELGVEPTTYTGQ